MHVGERLRVLIASELEAGSTRLVVPVPESAGLALRLARISGATVSFDARTPGTVGIAGGSQPKSIDASRDPQPDRSDQ
jgi:hypothetical protein